MSMIPSSGFFVAPQLPSETHDSGLDCLCEPADGSCILLKGSREDRLVVYKALKAAYRDDPVCRRILRREYEIGRFLKHPGICEILDWVHLPTYGDAIEMEYIEGSTLDAWLDAHRNETAKQRKILTDLCDALEYLHRKQVVYHSDVGMLGGTLHEGALHLKTCVVLMVKDAEVAVSALLVKIEGAIGTAVEVDAVIHKILDTRRSLLHHNLDNVFLRQEVTRHHSVVDVLLEGVGDVGNSRNAALREISVGVRY